MTTLVIIQGGSKGATLNELYNKQVMIGGKRQNLLKVRYVGPLYQTIQHIVKERGFKGVFTVGEYSKEQAELLSSPGTEVMLALQAMKFKVIGVIWDIEPKKLKYSLPDYFWPEMEANGWISNYDKQRRTYWTQPGCGSRVAKAVKQKKIEVLEPQVEDRIEWMVSPPCPKVSPYERLFGEGDLWGRLFKEDD